MTHLFSDWSDRYITSETSTKTGLCRLCISDKWPDSTVIKDLYIYKHPQLNDIYICKGHIGCMEVGREMAEAKMAMNDIERHKDNKELEKLIEEGQRLLK